MTTATLPETVIDIAKSAGILSTRVKPDLDLAAPGRRIVCAANRNKETLLIGVRHWDAHMHKQLKLLATKPRKWEQGFIDQQGVFLTREEAWVVATAAGQIIRRVGGDEGCLYSENLY